MSAIKKAGLQSLSDYIAEHHNGNNSDFARALGVERNQVQQWLKASKPVYVVDCKMMALMREIDYGNSTFKKRR